MQLPVHPSDMCIALAALEAVVRVTGRNGDRAIPFADFHRLPGETPDIDSNLGVDEIITSIDLPSKGFADHHAYLKVRDRKAYAFALRIGGRRPRNVGRHHQGRRGSRWAVSRTSRGAIQKPRDC